MSDLSRLLSDVYGDGGATAPAVPEWSSDEALEDTFATWVPGPPADAPAAERAFSMDDDADAPVRERPTFDEVFAAFGPDDARALYADADVATDVVLEPATEPVAISELPAVDELDGVADLAGFTNPFTSEVEPVAEALAPAPFAVQTAITRWIPSDDDILPLRGTAAKRLSARAPRTEAPALPKEPKAKLQLGRKVKAAPAPAPVPEVAPLDEILDRSDPTPAPVPAPAEVAPARRRRKPAPKHAKPKEGLRLSLRSKPKVEAEAEATDDLVATEAPTKRRSFRLR